MKIKQLDRQGQTFFIWNKDDKYGIKVTRAVDGVRVKHGDLNFLIAMPASALSICDPEIQVKNGNLKVIR